MEIGRRNFMAGSAAAAVAATTGSGAEAASNPLAAILSKDRTAIRVVRVKAPVGAPPVIAIEEAAGAKLANTPLVQFLVSKADKVAVYSAPPGLKVPERAAGKGGEMLYVVKGSTTIAAGSAKHACGLGTLVMLDEGASYTERAGPRGYTAIKVRLQES